MFYQTESLRPGLTRIWDVAHTAIYLVEGSERAVLIDTGVGVGSLKAVVDGLTDKPVTVLLTHAHVDHALGTAGFDDVRVSPEDAGVYAEHCGPEVRKGYVQSCVMQGGDAALIGSVRDGDYLEAVPFERFGALRPGDRFDLGGVSVEVLRGAGHTPGSLTMLIPQWRVLLLGDACNQFTFLFDRWASTVSDYRRMLAELKKETDGRYDRVILSHGTGDGPVNMIEGVLEVCDEIIGGKTDDLPFRSPLGTGLIAKAMNFRHFCRADGGVGNIIYHPERIGCREEL